MLFLDKILYTGKGKELPEDLVYIIRILLSLDLVLIIWSLFLAIVLQNYSVEISLLLLFSIVFFVLSVFFVKWSYYLLARVLTSIVLPLQAVVLALLLKGTGSDILAAKVFLASLVWIPLIIYRKQESFYIYLFISYYFLVFILLRDIPVLELNVKQSFVSNLLLYASFSLFGLIALIYRVQINKYIRNYEQYSQQLEEAMEQVRDLYMQYQSKEEDLRKANQMLQILNDRLAAKNKEILQNNQLLKVITFNIQEIIFLLDESGNIVFYNNPALSVLGYASQDMTSSRLSEILGIPVKDLWTVAENDKHISELKVKRRNGKFLYLSLWAQRITFENESLLLLTLFNITEQKLNDIIIKRQYNKLLQYSRDLHQSLVYAKRIQKAVVHFDLIPRLLSIYFSEHFIFLRPKNLVSGDFYFVKNLPGELVFAVGDCTGHGVPGAFMTIISIAVLNEIAYRYPESPVDDMLEKMMLKLNEALATEKAYIMDSVDIALCKYRTSDSLLQYSGINIPLYLVSDGKMHKLTPSKLKQHRFNLSDKFDKYEVTIKPKDVIYIATDGFRDQFGGERNKKYKRKRFLDLLLRISDKPLDEQKKILQKEFAQWKGKHEQTDDILVMGLRK